MLNWIVWHRTVFDIETVPRLNWIVWNRKCFWLTVLFQTIKLNQLSCAIMLNRIVWNRTVYLYKNGFGIKYHTKVDIPWNPNKQKI